MRNDSRTRGFYPANMAKRSRPIIQVTWYLREWMDTLHVRQADMIERTGWSKTTASLLYNCQQDFNPALLRDAAVALNLRPYELLMHPADAMGLRRLRDTALSIAAETPADYAAQPDLQPLGTGTDGQ